MFVDIWIWVSHDTAVLDLLVMAVLAISEIHVFVGLDEVVVVMLMVMLLVFICVHGVIHGICLCCL